MTGGGYLVSQMIKTQHGLKYLLSDEMYQDVELADAKFKTLWTTLNIIIESSVTLPQFLAFLTFVICSFQASI